MATLPWTNINADIACKDTKKKFFGKYLYKIIVYVPGARLIGTKLPKNKTVGQLLALRIEAARRDLSYTSWSYGKSYYQMRFTELSEDASVYQLEYFIDLKANPDVKFRIEEPHLTIYCNDEQILFDIARKDPERAIKEFYRPANEDAVAALDVGDIIVKKPTDYLYKIEFREGFVDREVNDQVYNYLMSLGDDVKLTNGCAQNLTLRAHWNGRSYFYAKDPQVLTFLTLIAPGKVSGIFKLVYLEQ